MVLFLKESLNDIVTNEIQKLIHSQSVNTRKDAMRSFEMTTGNIVQEKEGTAPGIFCVTVLFKGIVPNFFRVTTEHILVLIESLDQF